MENFTAGGWRPLTPLLLRRVHIRVDLYCTLSGRIGRRSVVRESFGVQAKSGTGPWVLMRREVMWLVEYPTAMFLAFVDKKKRSVSVYHLMPGFCVWALQKYPNRLELERKDTDDGKSLPRENGEKFSLSAPVVRAAIADMMKPERMEALGNVF